MDGHRSILVVDDEPAIRGLLSLTLEDENYDVETAEDGQAALEQVQARKPDAILLDLMMPKTDGWAVIDRLAEAADSEPIPIVTMSAVDRYQTVGEHGVKAFLSKPFEIDTLLIVLEDIFKADHRPA